MKILNHMNPVFLEYHAIGKNQILGSRVNPLQQCGFLKCNNPPLQKVKNFIVAEKASMIKIFVPFFRPFNVLGVLHINFYFSSCYSGNWHHSSKPTYTESRKVIHKSGKKEHHLWSKRDSAGSGQKALDLVRIISGLPNEKEAVYGALDKWIAWETEFPLIAAAKALRIFRKRNQWKQVIQVAKWMLSKGQGATMGTYDTLLLAFDMDGRVDEAERLWNMVLHAHNRSISKRLFSRIISLYDHHNVSDKVIEAFADMEELGVKPDQDTTRRVARAFQTMGQEDKKILVLSKYLSKWKYIHFKGERVRVRRDAWEK